MKGVYWLFVLSYVLFEVAKIFSDGQSFLELIQMVPCSFYGNWSIECVFSDKYRHRSVQNNLVRWKSFPHLNFLHLAFNCNERQTFSVHRLQCSVFLGAFLQSLGATPVASVFFLPLQKEFWSYLRLSGTCSWMSVNPTHVFFRTSPTFSANQVRERLFLVATATPISDFIYVFLVVLNPKLLYFFLLIFH